jgi:lipid-binding SYLF domain-containing protein
MGSEIGGGLVSCRLAIGGWSAPSYLALGSVSIGPNMGLLNEDSTFIFGSADSGNIKSVNFKFEAGVYATAGGSHVEASATSDGCFVIEIRNERCRHCTIAISDTVGLHAGANVTAGLTRHMTGLFGAGRFGRNARVYGAGGVSVTDILNTALQLLDDL